MVGVRIPMMAMISIVLVTPALLALNFCSFLRIAPPIMDAPGMRSTPARMEPTMDPSTRLALPWVRAMLYKIISMMDPKEALMTAPIPIDDCAEIEATAIPMK